MSTPLADASRQRAQALQAFRRANRTRPQFKLFNLYLLVLTVAIGGTLGEHALAALLGHGISHHQLLLGGPIALLLLTIAALRFGSWHGPVSFSRPDIALLLTAPIGIAALVRPKLDHALTIALLAGACLGAVTTLVMSGGPARLGAARVVAAALAGASCGAGLTAVSWLVESSRRGASLLRRVGPAPLLLVAAGLTAADRSLHMTAIWVGPWSWAVAPLVGGGAWPLALALLAATAAGVVVVARGRAGHADAELFSGHADVRANLGASAFTMNYRAAGLAYRAAASSPRRGAALPVRAPRTPRLLLLWRDTLALGYEPSRLVWASLLAIAATLEGLAHPGRLLPCLLSAIGLYAAATLLTEPARVDVDNPDRVRVLSGRRFARILVGHAWLPALTLSGVAALTLVGTVLAGGTSAESLLLIPALVVPSVLICVLATLLQARRGGQISPELMVSLLAKDPSNPGGAAAVALWLAPFLVTTLGTVALPLVLAGHVIRHHPASAVSAVVGADVVMLIAAVTLLALGLGTRLDD